MDFSNPEKLYLDANAAYSRQQFEDAVRLYSAAMDGADQALQVKLLSNRAECYLKMREYEKAKEDCSVIILRCDDPKFKAKACYRRAVAWEYLADIQNASRDADEAALLYPNDETVIKMAVRLRKAAALDCKIAKEEEVPWKMISEFQCLRLIMLVAPPKELGEDELFSTRICIGNELGLWNKSTLAASSMKISVSCEVVKMNCMKDSDPIRFCVEENESGVDVGFVDEQGKVSISNATLCGGLDDCTHCILKFQLSSPLPNGATVLPVLSLPIRLKNKHAAARAYDELMDGVVERMQVSCIRDHEMDSDNRYYVFESPGYLGIGGKVWDSTYVLLDFLRTHAHRYVTGRCIVELGAGTGLAGISLCGMSPRRVVLTDMEEVVPLIGGNILLNSLLAGSAEARACLNESYHACAHAWGSSVDPVLRCLQEELEVVIASDVVYYPEAYDSLIASICSLVLSAKDVVCILAHRHRHPQDAEFFNKLGDAVELKVQEIPRKHSAKGPVLSDVKLFTIERNNR